MRRARLASGVVIREGWFKSEVVAVSEWDESFKVIISIAKNQKKTSYVSSRVFQFGRDGSRLDSNEVGQ
jgi:hypothetical protein